jgi:predicted acyl esterase
MPEGPRGAPLRTLENPYRTSTLLEAISPERTITFCETVVDDLSGPWGLLVRPFVPPVPKPTYSLYVPMRDGVRIAVDVRMAD